MRMKFVKKFNHFRALANSVDTAMNDLLELWAEDTKINWQAKMLTSPPTGITYYRHDRPSPHTASSPGNPPRVWTGDYFDSIRAEQTGDTTWETMTDDPKAGELEYVLNRPVMEPVAAEAPGRVDRLSPVLLKRLWK